MFEVSFSQASREVEFFPWRKLNSFLLLVSALIRLVQWFVWASFRVRFVLSFCLFFLWWARLKVKSEVVTQSCLTLCNPMDYSPPGSWDFPGKDTGVGCHFLLQGIFPTQGSNLGLLHCRQILYCPSHQGTCYERMRLINRLIWGKSYSSSPSLLVYMGDMVIFLCMHLYL